MRLFDHLRKHAQTQPMTVAEAVLILWSEDVTSPDLVPDSVLAEVARTLGLAEADTPGGAA